MMKKKILQDRFNMILIQNKWHTYKTLQDRFSRNKKYNFPKIIHQKYIFRSIYL